MSTRASVQARPGGLGSLPAAAILVVAAVAGVVYLALAPFPLVQDWLYAGFGLAAVLAILSGILVHRPARPLPWLFLAGGTGLFATGDLLWAVLELMGESPFPSVADVAYLAGYPVLLLAYVVVIVVRVAGGDRSGLLDAAILAIAAALLGWVALLRPVLDAGGDPVEIAIGVAYPLGDLVLIGIVIAMLAAPGRRGGSFALLLGSLLLQLAGDLAYTAEAVDGSFVDGGLADLTWLASYALVAAAAVLPSMRLVATPNPVQVAWLGRVRLGVTTLAMLTGPILVLGHQDRDVPLLVGGSAILSLLVVARLAAVVGALARDNTARRSLEDELSFRATHDPLTGLANRRAFLERLETALEARHHDPAPLAVLFLDLDDFKGVNDTMGHATGDALLVAVAGRVRAQLREGDLAARLGGDEFGILLHADEPVATRIAQRLIDGLGDPVVVGDRAVVTGGSIGIALAGDASTSGQLMADADIAMYKAKAMGKGTLCVYADALRDGVVDRMRLEADLRLALDGDGLLLEYLPIVDLVTGRAVGVEALVRWAHPVRGRLEPSAFVPLAESMGLGPALGTWVLEAACRQVAAWRATLDPGLCLEVNLAPRQLAGTDLVAVAWGAARASGLPMHALIVDVTEGLLLLEAPEVAANLAALRALGARVAIDDGTGASTRAGLAGLPVDILKLDGSLVAGLPTPEGLATVQRLVEAAASLGLDVIAEGVEHAGLAAAAQRAGCRLGQGFALAPPMAPGAFEDCDRVVDGPPAPPFRPTLPALGAFGST